MKATSARRAVVLGAAAVAIATSARATPCIRPDLIETIPPDGATEVPLNARLAARYAPSAEYLNEPIALDQVGVGAQSSQATFNPNEGLLTIAPDAPLAPGAAYDVEWPALRGLTTAVLGKGAPVHFTAGTDEDREAPHFGGIASVAWDVDRSNDDCTDSPQDRYRFDVALGDVSDDAPRELLTLVVFQTAGPTQSGGPEPVLAARVPARGEAVRVDRAIDDAVGRVCFAALVRDSLGRTSGSPSQETCVTTVRPPFFYGCALAMGRAGSEGGWLFVLALGTARARARRRGAA
jgi:hypothetical protein